LEKTGTNPLAQVIDSARWSRRLSFSGGLYRFSMRADDGIRFYLDDELLIDEWQASDGSAVYTVDVPLEGRHRLRVEYYEEGGRALVEFWWQRLEATPTWTPVTPTSTFTPTPTPTTMPYATVEPTAGQGNTQVTVRGGGFPPTTQVNAHLATLARASLANSEINVYATTQTTHDGHFSLTFAIPNRWPDGSLIEPQPLVILVATHDFRLQASALFDYQGAQLTPTINITPASGGPGTSVVITGSGFPANVNVNLHLGAFDTDFGPGTASSYATTTTARDGAYHMAVVLPATWPDGTPIRTERLLLMVATDDFSVQVSTTLRFLPSPPTVTVTPTQSSTATPTLTSVPATIVDQPSLLTSG
jgi:hypothetical protein